LILSNNENEYFEIYKQFIDPKEYLSEKLKKYDPKLAKNDLQKNLPQYQIALAMARTSFPNKISVYKLRNSVIEKVKNTKFDDMLDETPYLLTEPFIIETINDNDNLFGDIISIVGFYSPIIIDEKLLNTYKNNPDILTKNEKDELSGIIIHEGKNYVFALLIQTKNYYDNELWKISAGKLNKVAELKGDTSFRYHALNTFTILPNIKYSNWIFDKKDYNRNILMEKNYCRLCLHSKSCDKIGRYTVDENYNSCIDGLFDNILGFIATFNHLLFAKNTPIEVEDKSEKIKRNYLNKKKKLTTKEEEWIIKYLYINNEKIQYEENEEYTKMKKDGYIAKDVKVNGHLRHQAYGTGFSLHRWIYIESFTSIKWVKDGDTKIIVSCK